MKETRDILSSAILLVGLATTANGQGSPELFPPNAKPGECYARVFVSPVFETSTQRVLKRNAFEKIAVVPAEYRWDEETVVIQEASERLEVVPATYGWEEERVLVKPASKRVVQVPAVFETVTERVLDQPAHTVWKKGRGPIEKIDNGTGEIMCLIEVPATYKTLTQRVVKTPATTREIEIPAEYKTVKKRVMKTPPTTRKVTIPAEYGTVKVRKIVSEPRVKKTAVPEEYQVVAKRTKVAEGRMEWRPVLCETNLTHSTVMSIQQGLKNRNYYRGPVDGIFGTQTMSALRSYQQSLGLPEGGITLQSLRKLGVQFNR